MKKTFNFPFKSPEDAQRHKCIFEKSLQKQKDPNSQEANKIKKVDASQKSKATLSQEGAIQRAAYAIDSP